MKTQLLLALSLSFLILGCRTVKEGNDPLVVRTEQTLVIARDTLDLFLSLEYQYHPVVRERLPEMQLIVQTFTCDSNTNGMADALDWLSSLNSVKNAYKNKLDTKDNLIKALAIVEAALAEAQEYTSIIERTIKPN